MESHYYHKYHIPDVTKVIKLRKIYFLIWTTDYHTETDQVSDLLIKRGILKKDICSTN